MFKDERRGKSFLEEGQHEQTQHEVAKSAGETTSSLVAPTYDTRGNAMRETEQQGQGHKSLAFCAEAKKTPSLGSSPNSQGQNF